MIAVLIPALNEEASIATVVRDIRERAIPGLRQVIVADNGSTDATAARAREAGALVVHEVARGYGAACLAAIAAMDPDVEIVVFIDADGADAPSDLASLLAPIQSGAADLVIGSRVLGRAERGAMTLPQRFGNWLATRLIWLVWGVGFTDLGPFRAIRRSSLAALGMTDRDFGWTVEMQVRAVRLGIKCVERPVAYRRRVGVSKISGTLRGVILAGAKILYVIGREACSHVLARASLPPANAAP